MKRLIIILLIMFSTYHAQESTFQINGVASPNQNYTVFRNATIHVSYNNVMQNADLLIKRNKIVKVGQNIKVPKNTIIYDLNGSHIYPSFIDIYSSYGMPKLKSPKRAGGPQYERTRKGAYNWNDAVKSEVNASELFKADVGESQKYLKNCFGAVLTHNPDGIFRGTGAFVLVGDKNENSSMLSDNIAAFNSFNKGSSTQNYPNSLMGAIALVRQTYYDAKWYSSLKNITEFNISLKSINENINLTHFFEVTNKLNLLRALKIGKEFNLDFVIKGAGDEYQIINYLKDVNAKLIIPLSFPKAYDVSNPNDADLISLKDLKHWEAAPANAGILSNAGVEFAFTSNGLRNDESLFKNIRKAVEFGLSKEQAIKALTITPAIIINQNENLGTLEKNKIANFVILSNELFDDQVVVLENWVNGKPHIINNWFKKDIRGEYSLQVGSKKYTLIISGIQGKLKSKVTSSDTILVNSIFNYNSGKVSISIKPKEEKEIFLNGYFNSSDKSFSGTFKQNGKNISWLATFDKKLEVKNKKKVDNYVGETLYPYTAYGKNNKFEIKKETVLIKNGTLWTNEEKGIIKNSDLLIKNGKIVKFGTDLKVDKNVRIIDVSGKHVTTGIIDEHSHIAGSGGINEGTQAVSSEVRIGDILNSEDVNIYRQLAGGVTTSQILHGSANPIGGQSAIIKLRWGALPEQLKIKGADKFIKCALGENVKQSNWGNGYNIRFPQTRMGVEQVFVDAFNRAKTYEKKWKKYNSLSKTEKNKINPPRKDLELDALLEIVNSERFITCHSYVQSEINMLMKVAEKFGFTINTFTHILEGYKVADKMKQHGAGGSSFSDWWAYKFEVYEAIPQNAGILNSMGVTTAINSDDAEMARRLNQEAAKSIKYTGMSEEDAWKLVTLNPAKLLHLDDRLGSLKPGKDADVVIWNENPLSIYAKPEITFVDGQIVFSLEEDLLLREKIANERKRIIDKLKSSKEKDKNKKKPAKQRENMYKCDTVILDYLNH